MSKTIEQVYPLSPLQQGMLFHSLQDPGSGMYIEQLSCLVHGLDLPRFQTSWEQVLQRHMVLRTAFAGWELKEPVQVVYKKVDLNLEVDDWRSMNSEQQSQTLEEYLERVRRAGFDLRQPPLMRLAAFRISEDTWRFVWSHHHILLDGWSVPILMGEVFQHYLAPEKAAILPAPRPYRDYILWLHRQDEDTAQEFWRSELEDIHAPTPLPLEGVYPEQGYGEEELWLEPETTSQIKELAQGIHVTLNTLVMGAWGLLLSRLSGEEDPIFGAVVSGRPAELDGAQEMVGLLINTLPVRVRVNEELSVRSYLTSIQQKFSQARQFEYSPLVQIQACSGVPRNLPLFESILAYENYPLQETLAGANAAGLEIEDLDMVEKTHYPLNLIAGCAERMMLKLGFDRSHYDPNTIRRLLDYLRRILAGMADRPSEPLQQITLLSESEYQQQISAWNANTQPLPLVECLHQLVEEQARCHPDAEALRLEDTRLTYADMNRQANQLARFLRIQGVQKGSFVAVYLERSFEMVVAVLAVIKAGGAYVPIDPHYPAARISHILHDSGAVLLITRQDLANRLTEDFTNVFCLDAQDLSFADLDNENLTGIRVGPEDPVYMIYTSGSTGLPKGVVMSHRGVANYVRENFRAIGLPAPFRMMQFFSFGFDGASGEIFTCLCHGSVLVLVPPGKAYSGPELLDYLREQKIEVTYFTPSGLGALPDGLLPELKVFIVGGEVFPPRLVKRWGRGRRMLNEYGPTECSVCSTIYPIDPAQPDEKAIPIGKSITNIHALVVDSRLRPLPVGAPGELLLGGVGVGREYHNRPELTTQRFIANTFGMPGTELLYRTGDLVRWLPGGVLEYLGRIDTQIKLRGFRVELGEIEAALEDEPGVKQAAVVLCEEDGQEKFLAAYLVPSTSTPPDKLELRTSLLNRLPEYMVPACFIFLDDLPRSEHGKLDRRALPRPDSNRMADRKLTEPRDELEKQLERIWAEILGLEKVGIDETFTSLGGHSLMAIRLAAHVEQQLKFRPPLAPLLQGMTIAGMAEQARHELKTQPCLITLRSKGEQPPLFLIHPSGGSVHWYNDLAGDLSKSGHPVPIHAFQARNLEGNGPIQTRIEEMAATYAAELVQFYPSGPFFLGSWSMGVSIAFEMAQQLHHMGRPPLKLFLLDQGPHLPANIPAKDAEYLFETFRQQIPLTIDHLRALDYSAQIALIFHEGKKKRWILPEVTLDQFTHFVNLLRTHTEAWRAYHPVPYSGDAVVLRARSTRSERDLGWEEFILGRLTVHEVPGDHLSMMAPPHVHSLARIFSEEMLETPPVYSSEEAHANL